MSYDTQLGTIPNPLNQRVLAASVRGMSHVRTRRPCRDVGCHCIPSNGAGAVALSDINFSIADRGSLKDARGSLCSVWEGYLRIMLLVFVSQEV